MQTREFGGTGLRASILGLGCSRLGSVLGADLKSAEALVRLSLDQGVTYFDTSDLYGQGDSERLLGRVIGPRADVTVCTKVGKRHALAKRLLIPFKAPLKALAGKRPGSANVISQARAQPVPTCFEPAYLVAALHASLRRLGVERLGGVMLHSPDADTLRHGAAIEVLEGFKVAGKAGFIGVSIDDEAAGDLALSDPRIDAIQAPLWPGDASWAGFAARGGAKVAIVAREILGGHSRTGATSADAAIADAIGASGVSTALIGTTRPEHLSQAIRVANAQQEFQG